MTILDTTVLIDHLRGVGAARDYLRSLEGVPICSEVSRAEVIQGMRSQERPIAERLFSVLSWVAVDERIARAAGELGHRYRRTHPGLALADLIIAATALELDEPLATHNVRHYPMLRRLRAPY